MVGTALRIKRDRLCAMQQEVAVTTVTLDCHCPILPCPHLLWKVLLRTRPARWKIHSCPPPPVPGGPLTEHSDGGRAPVTQAFSLQVTCLSIGGNLSLCLTQLRAAMQKSLPGCSSTQLRPPSENAGMREKRKTGRDVGRRSCQSGEAVPPGALSALPHLTHRCA